MTGEFRLRKKGTPNFKLKQEREKRFWTLEDVSSRISNLPGFAPGEPDPRTVGRWERGISFPSPRYCRALCTIFQVEAQALGLIIQTEEHEDPELLIAKSDKTIPLVTQTQHLDDDVPQTPLLATMQKKGIASDDISLDKERYNPATTETDKNTSSIHSINSQRVRKYRQRTLKHVRQVWITTVLSQSFLYNTPLSVSFEHRPEAVLNPWSPFIPHGEQATQIHSDEVSLAHLYDEADGTVLLLGEPGSGKTIHLLRLAHTLLERAEQDESSPIPIVLLLSTWAESRQPLIDWLLAELELRYELPRAIGQHWLATDQFALLLDGLDEMPPHMQHHCLLAINHYRQTHPLTSLVVCCRSTSYPIQSTCLQLRLALYLCPLTYEQIIKYLTRDDIQQERAADLLHQHLDLHDFITTPLRLRLLIQTFQDPAIQEAPKSRQNALWLHHFFQHSIQHALERRGAALYYHPEQVISKLTQLADVIHHGQPAPGWLSGTYVLTDIVNRVLGRPIHLLDYAVERQLLQKNKDGYTFSHPRLLDYFSSLL